MNTRDYPVGDALATRVAELERQLSTANASIAMKDEALKDARASFLGLQPDFGGPISAQMGKAIERINTALSASSSTVSKWEAEHAAKVLEENGHLFDSQYIAGAKFGWNCCVGGDEQAFQKAINGRIDQRATKQVKE